MCISHIIFIIYQQTQNINQNIKDILQAYNCMKQMT